MSESDSPERDKPFTYEDFFKKTPDLFCICDLAGTVLDLNQAWENQLGIPTDKLRGRSVLTYVNHEDRPAGEQEIAKLQKGLTTSSFVNRLVRYGKKDRWFRWSATPDLPRQVFYAVGIDITTETEARTNAELQSQLVSDIFSQAPCLASVTEGPNHVFRFVNDAYKRLTGHRDLIGKPVISLFPDLEPTVLRILDTVYQTGQKYVSDDMRTSADWLADGHVTEKVFTVTYAPVFGADHTVSGIWTLAYEITEQKRLESIVLLNERVAAIGRMAAGIAHEINNPLAYILGGLQLIQKKSLATTAETLDESKAEVARLIEKTEQGLLRIRDIVKSMNRLSNDGKTEALQDVNIRKILATALDYAKNEACKQARIILEADEHLYVKASKGTLIQVFLNLIINSCHAIHHGTNTDNEIKLVATRKPPGTICISVTDTGHGIPKKNLDRIFDPFFTSKPVGEGSGLGLSISHGIIQSLGGTIRVVSEVGRGTTFLIELPEKV